LIAQVGHAVTSIQQIGVTRIATTKTQVFCYCRKHGIHIVADLMNHPEVAYIRERILVVSGVLYIYIHHLRPKLKTFIGQKSGCKRGYAGHLMRHANIQTSRDSRRVMKSTIIGLLPGRSISNAGAYFRTASTDPQIVPLTQLRRHYTVQYIGFCRYSEGNCFTTAMFHIYQSRHSIGGAGVSKLSSGTFYIDF
jgi:hypothetical protein